MTKTLRPYQTDVIDRIYHHWKSGVKNVLAVVPTGGGKCLGENTPILMYDGSIEMVQNISVGDKLMGPDSKPRVVKTICSGKSELFKITPVKGEPWICNDVHILSLIHTETAQIVNIPLDKYLQTTNNFKHLHKQYRVGVNFNKRSTFTDPYVLGIYLAEGNWRNALITNPDKEILDYLKKFARRNDLSILDNPGQGCRELHFRSNSRKHNTNIIRKIAKSCTSQNDRWIPREFLINNREERLKLLAGILDGDGHCTHNGFEIITKYKSLNRDILFLVRSLGMAAYSKKAIKGIKSTGFKGEYFRIYISGQTDEIPTKVKRKKCKARKQIKDILRTGFKVESLGKGKYYGFEIDRDRRFLLGDFTVAHNTVSFCSIAIDVTKNRIFGEVYPTAILCHRKELVSQICLTLAEEGIPHNIIAPRNVILGIVANERNILGKQFYDYNSQITVLSVDTLNSRILVHEKWAKGIKLWITDEAAHLLKENKWGRSVGYFPNAIGLGVTATPERLDKRGLGRHADGVFDVMVEGPNTKWMIDNGFLCNYKIVFPESDYRLYLKESSGDSDYSKEAMIVASQKSHIVGDVIKNYLKFGKGKQAIIFASDIGAGERMEKQFIEAGVKAKLLTGMTDDGVRLNSMIAYRKKDIHVLINVDLFDEGLDVPGIEYVAMARPTKSLGKYLQMIGRGLRPIKGKPYLILVDHVGNIKEHGLPDSRRKWTLDRITRRKKKVNLIRICKNHECNAPYDRILSECPYCGLKDKPAQIGGGGGRISPSLVDGDLVMIDPETLRELEKNTVLEDPASVAQRVAHVAGTFAGIKAMKNQQERIETQKQLAEKIAVWAGGLRHHGHTDRMINKQFFVKHDMTIWEALGKPKASMIELMNDIEGEL